MFYLKNNLIKYKKEYISSLFILFITTIMTFWFFNLWGYDFNVPYNYTYGRDGMGLLKAIKALYENNNLYVNKYLGAPFNAVFYDFPVYGDTFHFAVLNFLSHLFNNYTLSFNIYFFSIFPITALLSYLVMNSLKINNIISILGSINFTFLFYRFARNTEHYFLSAYTLIPLGILILFWFIYDNNFFNFNKDFFKYKRNYYSIIILIITAISGIYYSFFLCFFIIISLFYKIINENKIAKNIGKCILKSFSLIFIIGITTIFAALPTFLNLNKYGASPVKTERLTYEAEIYGLKIIQLFLPPHSGLKFLQEKISHYNSVTPFVNENTSAYLGIIGIIGFISLLIVIFINLKNNNYHNNLLKSLCVLNITGILLATVGGFSSIFSLFISSLIRGYNRISVYIAYFCILAVCILLTSLSEKINLSKTEKVITASALSIIFLFCTIQQSVFTSNESIKASTNLYYIHDKFIKQIEDTVPPDSMIFQLPYQGTPEQIGPNGMPDYLGALGYLHSKNLHWSFGDYKGRSSDEWVKQTSSLPVDKLIDKISFAGFSGIYIDTLGYTTEELNKLQNDIYKKIKEFPIESENKELLFYNMTNYNKNHKAQYTQGEWDKKSDEALMRPLIATFEKGFYDVETDNISTWRWCDKEGIIEIINDQEKTVDYTLTLHLSTGYEEYSKISINSGNETKTFEINSEINTIEIPLKLKQGKNIITLVSNAEKINNPSDSRKMYFRIENFHI